MDAAAYRSNARVIQAGRDSAGRIAQQVHAYARQGMAAAEIVQRMREHHGTAINPEWASEITLTERNQSP